MGSGQYVQIPEPQTQGGLPDPVLVEFEPVAIQRLPVRVRFGPTLARETCKVQVVGYYQGGEGEREVMASGPPAPLPALFQLPPGNYSVAAQAERHAIARQPCTVHEAQELALELQPGQPTNPVAAAKTGNLQVICGDPNVAIVVSDAERRLQTPVRGTSDFTGLPRPLPRGGSRRGGELPPHHAARSAIRPGSVADAG